jgi:hypothetical protein
MGGGGAASDWRRERKEERAEWATKAGWASFGNGKQKWQWSWVGLRGTFGSNSNQAAEKNRELFFEFLFQGNGIQIKSFEYFQTKFELDLE